MEFEYKQDYLTLMKFCSLISSIHFNMDQKATEMHDEITFQTYFFE